MPDCDCPLRGETPAEVDRCDVENEDLDLICSLPEGHDGQHVACSVQEHPVAAWGDDDA